MKGQMPTPSDHPASSSHKSAFGTYFLLNVVCGSIWLFLVRGPGVGSFVVGFVLSFLIMALFSRALGAEDYIRRCRAFAAFLLIFLRAFVKSNLEIARATLTMRNEQIKADFIAYSVGHLNHAEIVVLSQCITLTPGTTSALVSEDEKTLYVHAFDARNPQALCEDIQTGLEEPLLRFMR